ncbi:LOW QUALITY PROTEIN: gonadal protein gdl [Metopolophium dirhodum]|uniref:LOW QUALITY PROTEIN: gonadal protein gdl n=1 Tax=Metopolophium dirhodum TaxID=44670 RepID=UPI00298F822D|nr:LOW QUALITY PROTEIN: gonadal protein gdl [Metopolophium dirhodum]
MSTSDNQNETQSRLYFLNEQLQKMVHELPRKYQQRIPNELLCELTECLLDKTLYSIVKELTDIQHVTEKQMFQKRLEMINKHSVLFKLSYKKLLKSDMVQPGKTEMRLKLQAEHRKNLREFDKRIVTELDEKRREQQNTLHMAGVPGFDVTDDAGRIQVQIRLCDFIIRLSLIDKKPDEV